MAEQNAQSVETTKPAVNGAKFLLATKEAMTEVFDEGGRARAGTTLRVLPNVVTQVKTQESDGYEAVQVGTGKKRKVGKALLGHLKGKGPFRVLREFRETDKNLEVGSVITSDVFEVGDTVSVSSISKGKGFQGVVKRHGFHGGRRSHGQKHSEREPGSIGAKGVARVFKGTRMAGRMGGSRVTVTNLTVLSVDTDNGTLVVSGAVPGRRGTIVEVRNA